MPRPVIEIKEPYTPELLAEVAGHIEQLLATIKNPRVFEFGGGFSTVWFAGLANKVVTAEHDPEWYKETKRALTNTGLSGKVELIQTTEDNQAEAIDGRGMFDLVLVDGWDFQREPGALKAMKHIRPGGWLVLDDSQWDLLQPVRQQVLEAGWSEKTFSGQHIRKDGDLRHHQTSIFQRPGKVEKQEPVAVEEPVEMVIEGLKLVPEPMPEPEKPAVKKSAAPKPTAMPVKKTGAKAKV